VGVIGSGRGHLYGHWGVLHMCRGRVVSVLLPVCMRMKKTAVNQDSPDPALLPVFRVSPRAL
jgi:hypothetical protein